MAHGRPAKCHTSDRITDRPSSSRQRYTELECSDWVSSPTRAIKVSLLHSHLQGVNFQRCKCASGSNKEPGPAPSTWGMRETAACRPSPAGTILQFHHLPPPLPPLGSNASSLFTWGQPLYASYCTVLLYFAGEANGNPLQYSCLENPRGRGAWQTIVQRVVKSQTQLKQLSTHTTQTRLIMISSFNYLIKSNEKWKTPKKQSECQFPLDFENIFT